MTVDLRTAKPGDRFEARNGGVWTYVRALAVEEGWIHWLLDEQHSRFQFFPDGRFRAERYPSPHDLIRSLATPAQGDLVRRLREFANRKTVDGYPVPFSPEILNEAATRIEALSARAEEAEAENARLSKREGYAIRWANRSVDSVKEAWAETEADRDAWKARAEEAEAALAAMTDQRDLAVHLLRPFANIAWHVRVNHPGWDHDDFQLSIGNESTSFAPFRAARNFLERTKP